MDADGWITPTAKKKPRLNPDVTEVIDLDRDMETEVRSNGSTTTSVPSRSLMNPTKEENDLPSTSLAKTSKPATAVTVRPSCLFGSKCYRRNPNHLQEFTHPFLEEVYEGMKEAGNYSKIPQQFLGQLNRLEKDESVILEQASVLKDMDFDCKPSGSGDKSSTRNSNNIKESPMQKMDSNNSTYNSGGKWNQSMGEIREQARQKFIESQKTEAEANDNVKEKVKSYGKMNMQEKWNASCPFNYFLTKVTSIPKEKEGVLSANFTDLFDPCFGSVKALCHINFMIDPEWFMDQTIQAGLEGKPTWIIFDGDSKALQEGAEAFPWLKINGVKSPFPYGHHHTKMTIVQYSDCSARFMIYTANLIESDWDNRTQGIWISPRCPKLAEKPSATVGDSRTKFKSDIIQYLQTYPVKASAAWIDVVKAVDCSEIKVFLVASAPVTAQSGTSGFQWGTMKMEKILRSIEFETEPNWPLIIQCSSIGSLGSGPQDWIQGELGSALSGKDKGIRGPIHVIYPSHLNVKESFDGLHGGGCLPYSGSTHMKQGWLEKHLCNWKADNSGRSRAVPHIKSYCRISPDNSKMAWFLSTSANLSKAAWGKLSKKGDRLSVMSWEAGVLFVPQFLTSYTSFTTSDNETNSSGIRFPLPFDIPVKKYEKMDKPWLSDTLQSLMRSSN